MHEDLDKTDRIARKVMGFREDEELEYDKVVEHYAFLLGYYATNLTDEEFVNIEYYESLNYSFNYCTGGCLEEYLYKDLNTDSLRLKASENEHYSAVLTGASKIVGRFNNLGLEDMASQMGASLYVIANAIYDYEKSLEDIDTKTLS